MLHLGTGIALGPLCPRSAEISRATSIGQSRRPQCRRFRLRFSCLPGTFMSHLHGDQFVIDLHFFGQEIRSNGRFVLVGELLVHVLIHQ